MKIEQILATIGLIIGILSGLLVLFLAFFVSSWISEGTVADIIIKAIVGLIFVIIAGYGGLIFEKKPKISIILMILGTSIAFILIGPFFLISGLIFIIAIIFALLHYNKQNEDLKIRDGKN